VFTLGGPISRQRILPNQAKGQWWPAALSRAGTDGGGPHVATLGELAIRGLGACCCRRPRSADSQDDSQLGARTRTTVDGPGLSTLMTEHRRMPVDAAPAVFKTVCGASVDVHSSSSSFADVHRSTNDSQRQPRLDRSEVCLFGELALEQDRLRNRKRFSEPHADKRLPRLG
jgi:hypothetical protein